MESHYNTTNLVGEELRKYNQHNQKQEATILGFIKESPSHYQTPYDISITLGIDLISTRRAMTNLTKKGLLIKSEKADFNGGRGRNTHAWKYAEKVANN